MSTQLKRTAQDLPAQNTWTRVRFWFAKRQNRRATVLILALPVLAVGTVLTVVALLEPALLPRRWLYFGLGIGAVSYPIVAWTASRLFRHLWFRIVLFVGSALFFWTAVGWLAYGAAMLMPAGSIGCRFVDACGTMGDDEGGFLGTFSSPNAFALIVLLLIGIWIAVQLVWPPPDDEDLIEEESGVGFGRRAADEA